MVERVDYGVTKKGLDTWERWSAAAILEEGTQRGHELDAQVPNENLGK